MVEEIVNATNKPKVKPIKLFTYLLLTITNFQAKPKSVYSWNVTDVQKWLRRHCSDYYPLYAEKFLQHDITGRALIRINDNSLLRLGIVDAVHREAIWRQILKLRLKTDIIEIRDLQRRNPNTMFYDGATAYYNNHT